MKRFVTEYEKDGAIYGSQVDAIDFDHARLICEQRGLGERVLGVLYAVIDCGDDSQSVQRGKEVADRMCKMFAATGEDEEPPEANEFDNEFDNN